MAKLNPVVLEEDWFELLGPNLYQLAGRLYPRPMKKKKCSEEEENNKWSKKKMKFSKDELYQLRKTVKHIGQDYQGNIASVKQFLSEISTELFKTQFMRDYPHESKDDMMAFRSYYQYAGADLTMLKASQTDPVYFDEVQYVTLDDEVMADIRRLFCDHYQNDEQLVINDDLVIDNNVQDDIYKFANKQQATCHWRKHSTEDIYKHKIRAQGPSELKPLIPPRQYLAEANELNGPGNESSGKIISFFPDDNDYAEHVRCVIRREKGSEKVLATYYKYKEFVEP